MPFSDGESGKIRRGRDSDKATPARECETPTGDKKPGGRA
jgi:hypothetical protein